MDLSTIKYVISRLSRNIFCFKSYLFTYYVPVAMDKFVKCMLEKPLLIKLNADEAILI